MNLVNRENLVKFGQDRFGFDFEAELVKAVGSELFSVSHVKTVVKQAIFYFGQFTICSRCAGSGKLSCFNHVERGVCFKCEGSGGKFAHSYDDTLKMLSAITKERFLKRSVSLAKSQVKSLQTKLDKQTEWSNKLAVKQSQVLATVPEDIAKSFSGYVELYFSNTNSSVFSPFHVQIVEGFKFNGWGSPKQIIAVTNSLNERLKPVEFPEIIQKFIAGEVQRFTGTVNSMTQEQVQVTNWISNTVTKIVLKGGCGEIAIVKTGNQKIIEQFQKYKDDGVKASFKAAVKWVNPSTEVNMVVFTSKGMKIDKYF